MILTGNLRYPRIRTGISSYYAIQMEHSMFCSRSSETLDLKPKFSMEAINFLLVPQNKRRSGG